MNLHSAVTGTVLFTVTFEALKRLDRKLYPWTARFSSLISCETRFLSLGVVVTTSRELKAWRGRSGVKSVPSLCDHCFSLSALPEVVLRDIPAQARCLDKLHPFFVAHSSLLGIFHELGGSKRAVNISRK